MRASLSIIFTILFLMVPSLSYSLPPDLEVEVVIGNLNSPVAIAFPSDGSDRIFYNELDTGNVRVIENGQLLATPFATVPISTDGERGLIGLAFDPDYAINGFVYIWHTNLSPLVNRVVRFTDVNNIGTNQTIVINNLPVGSVHNGGNIAFGADGKLYVSQGDVGNAANSQDTTATNRAGKILRYNKDGTIPSDNPLGSTNPIFAYGLRNSFDLTTHPVTDVVYASENGPDCDDEINKIMPGGNYGWRSSYPCGDTNPLFIQPIVRFTPTIAPTGITFYTGNQYPEFQNDLFFVDFNEGRIRRIELAGANLDQVGVMEIFLDGGFGALLDIVDGPDGNLYFTNFNSIMRIVNVAAICGDGIADPSEECDDGNTSNGDCCSSICNLDPTGTACEFDGDLCTLDECNGQGLCGIREVDDCNDGNNCTTDSCNSSTGCINTPFTCNGLAATICGDDLSNTINGSNGNDVILGFGGNDTINGRKGNDRICGGDGNDNLSGERGSDFLDGGIGFDICSGGRGRDTATACESTTSIP
jgi:cysteine-rich repeat protein